MDNHHDAIRSERFNGGDRRLHWQVYGTFVRDASASHANTLMLFAWESVSKTDAGIPTGFTLINRTSNGGGTNNAQASVCYQIFSSTQSSATYTSAIAGINGWNAMLRLVARFLIARQHGLCRAGVEAITIWTPVFAKVDCRRSASWRA
jgi:hypothetical protein